MREQIIEIRHPTGVVTLILPIALEKLSINTQKKLYRLLCENVSFPPENEETVRILDTYIPEWSEDCWSRWEEASKDFQEGWREPDPHKGPKEKNKSIRISNKYLTSDLKKTKAKYERSEKVLKAWTDTKRKYT